MFEPTKDSQHVIAAAAADMASPTVATSVLDAARGAGSELDSKAARSVYDLLDEQLRRNVKTLGVKFEDSVSSAVVFPSVSVKGAVDVLRIDSSSESNLIHVDLIVGVQIERDPGAIARLERAAIDREIDAVTESRKFFRSAAESERPLNSENLKSAAQLQRMFDGFARKTDDGIEAEAIEKVEFHTYTDAIGRFRIVPQEHSSLCIEASVDLDSDVSQRCTRFGFLFAQEGAARYRQIEYRWKGEKVEVESYDSQGAKDAKVIREPGANDIRWIKEQYPLFFSSIAAAANKVELREATQPLDVASEPGWAAEDLLPIEESVLEQGDQSAEEFVSELISGLRLDNPRLFVSCAGTIAAAINGMRDLEDKLDTSTALSGFDQGMARIFELLRPAREPAIAGLDPSNSPRVRAAAARLLVKMEIYEPEFEASLIEALDPKYRIDNYNLLSQAARLLSRNEGTLSEKGIRAVIELSKSSLPEGQRALTLLALFGIEKHLAAVVPELAARFRAALYDGEEDVGRSMLTVLAEISDREQVVKLFSTTTEGLGAPQLLRFHNWVETFGTEN